jgi:hypothetical protein
MTIKLLFLKSNEELIADVQEMVVGENEETSRVVGYYLTKPCLVKMRNPNLVKQEGERKTAGFSVSLYPWIPLSKDETIPVPTDWVITMVEPVQGLKEMYVNDVLNKNGSKADENSSTTEQSDSDNTD